MPTRTAPRKNVTPAPAATGPRFPIDELARRSGVTVRNIRAYQSAGLLPPPQRQGKSGLYGVEHARRLESIKELRALGLGLPAIRGYVEGSADGTALALQDTARLVAAQLALEDRPAPVTAAELRQRWGLKAGQAGAERPELLARLERMGVYRRIPAEEAGENSGAASGSGPASSAGERLEVQIPALEQVGLELGRLGVPPDATLDAMESLLRHQRAAAEQDAALLLEHVAPRALGGPGPGAGDYEGQGFQEIGAAIERLTPLLVQAAAAAFRLALRRSITHTLRRALSRNRPGGRG